MQRVGWSFYIVPQAVKEIIVGIFLIAARNKQEIDRYELTFVEMTAP